MRTQDDFHLREMRWCPVDAPSEGEAYQYDHPMQKYDLPWPVYRSIKYAMRNVRVLALHPPEMALYKQEECTGNVKRDLFRIYLKYKTNDRPMVGFKGGTLECDLLTELKIP